MTETAEPHRSSPAHLCAEENQYFMPLIHLKTREGLRFLQQSPEMHLQVLSQDSWTNVTQQMQFKCSFSARSLPLPTTRPSCEAQNDPTSLLPPSNAIPIFQGRYKDVGASLREVSQCTVSDISSSAVAQQECVGREEASVPPSPVSLCFQQ